MKMEKTMALEMFLEAVTTKTDFILEENGYNMHVIFFEPDYKLDHDDLDYFKARANYWKENNLQEGGEPFFWPHKMKLTGSITYGAIDSQGDVDANFNEEDKSSICY